MILLTFFKASSKFSSNLLASSFLSTPFNDKIKKKKIQKYYGTRFYKMFKSFFFFIILWNFPIILFF